MTKDMFDLTWVKLDAAETHSTLRSGKCSATEFDNLCCAWLLGIQAVLEKYWASLTSKLAHFMTLDHTDVCGLMYCHCSFYRRLMQGD